MWTVLFSDSMKERVEFAARRKGLYTRAEVVNYVRRLVDEGLDREDKR